MSLSNKYGNKCMRLILMFDLPTETSEDIKRYTKFKRHFESLGYTMLQFSVYVKSINVKHKLYPEIKKLEKFLPVDGKVRVISLTEFQYQQSFILIGGKTNNEIINSDKRHIII